MQISIEQHETVVRGVAAELAIQKEQLAEVKSDLNLAREDFNAVEQDRNLLSKQLGIEAVEYHRMLERIRRVALGEYPPCTLASEPEWSQALAAVEILFAQSETARALRRVNQGGPGICSHCGGPVVVGTQKRRKRK